MGLDCVAASISRIASGLFCVPAEAAPIEPVAATSAAAVEGPPAPGIPEAAEAAQVPTVQQGAAPGEDAPASVS
jgi:hypothetical protein